MMDGKTNQNKNNKYISGVIYISCVVIITFLTLTYANVQNVDEYSFLTKMIVATICVAYCVIFFHIAINPNALNSIYRASLKCLRGVLDIVKKQGRTTK